MDCSTWNVVLSVNTSAAASTRVLLDHRGGCIRDNLFQAPSERRPGLSGYFSWADGSSTFNALGVVPG
jgi:hypothetical protein